MLLTTHQRPHVPCVLLLQVQVSPRQCCVRVCLCVSV